LAIVGRRLGEVVETLGGASEALFGRAQVLIANVADLIEHFFHLFLRIRVGDLEVAQVVEHPADPGTESLFTMGDPAADLPLDHRGVDEVVTLGLGEPVRLRQGAGRVVDRRDGLLLHGEDPRQLLSKLSARVVELAGCVLLRDDPQAHLPALADVGSLDGVKVAASAQRDHRQGTSVRDPTGGRFPGVYGVDSADGAVWATQRGMATSSCGSDSPVATR
jgi:hypothetical protein